MYEVTVVYGAGKGKVMWPGLEIIVMIALSRKKSMQYVLLECQEAAEQCVIIVVDELSCCWRQPGTDQPGLHDERQLRRGIDHPPS